MTKFEKLAKLIAPSTASNSYVYDGKWMIVKTPHVRWESGSCIGRDSYKFFHDEDLVCQFIIDSDIPIDTGIKYEKYWSKAKTAFVKYILPHPTVEQYETMIFAADHIAPNQHVGLYRHQGQIKLTSVFTNRNDLGYHVFAAAKGRVRTRDQVKEAAKRLHKEHWEWAYV